MSRARDGYTSQPERIVMHTMRAEDADLKHPPQGSGPWAGRLNCGHLILRKRQPRVGSIVVCWDCAGGDSNHA